MLRILSAAVAAAAVFAAVPASAEMKTEWVEYSQGGMKLKAYMAYDDKITGKRPAVFVVHAREGMTPKTQQLTELWAKLGYVSFAADIFGYGQGILPKNVAEMTAQTQIFRKDPALTKARTQAGYDALIKNPMVDRDPRSALVGYCFGGDVGVEFGSTGAPLALNVSIHGSFGDYRARLGQERQGHVPDPAWRRGPGLSAHQGQHGGPGAARPPRPRSSSRSTAAPATASRARRARTRSAPTRSRSRRPRAP